MPRGPTYEVIAMYEDPQDRQATSRRSPGKAPLGGPSGTPAPRIRDAPDPRLSRSLEYGIAILESFSGERQALGIADLADIIGISRSTTHRYAITLVALGYLEQDSKRRYRLAARAASPGNAAIGAIRRQVPARAALEELRDATGHTVSMAVLEGTWLIYVHRLLGHRAGQHEIDRDLGVGATIPVHCTALGKILLASLSDADRRELLAKLKLSRYGPGSITDRKKLIAELDGVSVRAPVVSDEEFVRGARSIAMLVPRPRSEHPLAIDVTVPSAAYTAERLLKDIGPRVARAARLISGESRTLDDLEVGGRRVLLRADLNVPLKRPPGGPAHVADDTRIRAALPTIEELRGQGASIVLVSHLGRPHDREPELSMGPVAKRLRELVDATVTCADAVVGPSVVALAESLLPGEILVLENVRYERGETADDPSFARALAALAEVYVDDAFGSAHRAHASTEGVARLLPSAAGRLLQREVEVLTELQAAPARPLVAVLGGAKVADKLELIGSFLASADAVLIGGAMSFPFLAALGHRTGASLCDAEDIPRARSALERATRDGRRLCVPVDLVVAPRLDAYAEARTLADVEVPDGLMGLDIGPRTAELYAHEIAAAATVFWNGPMGAFEREPFAAGTLAIARALADNPGTTVVGGGETVEALRSFGLESRVGHISTGGGATLELLSGRRLPGVQALE